MIRNEPFFTHVYYHIYNKTIERRSIFDTYIIADYFYSLLWYYRSDFENKPCYSRYRSLSFSHQVFLNKKINKTQYFRVSIGAYCFMPNHFHLLLRQERNKGISQYIADCVNGITRYYNGISRRKGPIFLSNFRARAIYTEKELLHVSRYIHLNPTTSKYITIGNLANYEWSSYRFYVDKSLTNRLITPIYISSCKQYREFVEKNVEYQQKLHKHRYEKYMQPLLRRLLR